MIYATTPQIMQVLRGRLQLLGAATPAFGSTLGAQQIDEALIIQVGESIEASIDATLNLIYVLPIDPLNTAALNILRGIVCKLVVADVIPTHYFAMMNPTQGGDSGFGGLLRNEGIKELERYTAGYGVYYGGSGSNQSNRMGNQIQQCVPLPGVPLKATSDVHRPLQPFEQYAVKRVETMVGGTGINWGI